MDKQSLQNSIDCVKCLGHLTINMYFKISEAGFCIKHLILNDFVFFFFLSSLCMTETERNGTNIFHFV